MHSDTQRHPGLERPLRFAAERIRIPGRRGQEEAVARRAVDETGARGYGHARTHRPGNGAGRAAGTGDAPPVTPSSQTDGRDAGDAVCPVRGETGGWGMMHPVQSGGVRAGARAGGIGESGGPPARRGRRPARCRQGGRTSRPAAPVRERGRP